MLGLSLHIGFIHGNTRNAFVFDLSEFYKTIPFYEKIKKNSNSTKNLLDDIASLIYDNEFSLPDKIYALLSDN
jgi:CRISPR/Cas system-associated endonuclease Cas1